MTSQYSTADLVLRQTSAANLGLTSDLNCRPGLASYASAFLVGRLAHSADQLAYSADQFAQISLRTLQISLRNQRIGRVVTLDPYTYYSVLP